MGWSMMEDVFNPMQGRMTETSSFLTLSEEAFGLILKQECNRAERYSYYFSILMVGLEASESEDTAYMTVAKLIRSAIRNSDMICFVQSKDLAVILHEADVQDTSVIVERIRQKTQPHPPHLPQVPKFQNLRIGWACFPTHASTVTDLLQLSKENV